MNTALAPEKHTTAPWLWQMISIDVLDVSAGLAGMIFSMAFGGIPGLFLWAGGWGVFNVLRKTPIIPATIDLYHRWQDNRNVLEGQFRDVVAPGLAYNPSRQAAPPASSPVPASHPSHLTPRPVATRRPPQRPVASQPSVPPVAADINPRRPSATFNMREWMKQYRGVEKLPAFKGKHLVIFGPTGGGKSSLIKWIFRQRQDATLVIGDLHYEPGNWPSRAYVLGKGRNMAEIADGVSAIVAELDRRILLRANGSQEEFRPILLFVDEESSVAEEVPDAMDGIRRIAREGRKYGIFVIIAPHGPNLTTLGFKKGTGDQRANFVFIQVKSVPDEAQHLPRIVEAWQGSPRDGDYLGRYVVPAPNRYTAEPRFGLPRWLQQQPTDVESQEPEPVSDAQKPDEAAFRLRFTQEAQATRDLAFMLAKKGYRIRKISEFLPFANVPAREIAARAVDVADFLGASQQTPPAESDEERSLVLTLSGYGASPERIAALLHGNKAENAIRVRRYIAEAGNE